MRKLISVASVVSLAFVFACGGSGKKDAEEGGDSEDLREVEKDHEEHTLIPEEKYTEIKQFFIRKARVVSKCFPEAIDAGEVGKNDKGYVTVALTITKEGKPTKVKIGETNFKSKMLDACVIKYVERWTFPSLPKELPYSHTFVFESM